MTLEIIAMLFVAGLLAGFVAGMFGIGGGIVIVPILIYTFDYIHIPIEIAGVMAIATSVACVAFTGASSARAHFVQGNIEKSILPKLAIGVAIGGIVGSLIADYIGGVLILQMFVAFAYFCAYRTYNPQTRVLGDTFPKNTPFSVLSGGIIGTLGNVVGGGGGILAVPLMTAYKIPIHIAIGTSAVLGMCLAIPGAINYALLQTPDPVDNTIGYIHIPSVLCIALGSIFMTPLGARVATHMDTHKLKRYFAILIVIAATNILWRSTPL